jgi:hypothetical protein
MNVSAILIGLVAILPGLNELPPRPIPANAEYQANNITTVVFAGGPDDVDTICQAAMKTHDPRFQLVGCAMKLKKGGSVLVVENPCLYPSDPYARHVCHELAHINGWPADHPNPQ